MQDIINTYYDFMSETILKRILFILSIIILIFGWGIFGYLIMNSLGLIVKFTIPGFLFITVIFDMFTLFLIGVICASWDYFKKLLKWIKNG